MEPGKRLRQLLGQHPYRTKLGFIFVLSIAIFLLYGLVYHLGADPVWTEILLQFGVTFAAVGALQVVWDFLGGEPMELRIDELGEEVKKVQSSVSLLPSIVDGIGEVEDEMRDIQSSLGVLVHLTDSKIGIERVWADRGKWQLDQDDGLEVWRGRLCKAHEADIVSNTLKSNWMKDPFLQELFESIEDGTRVRILLYDPKSDALDFRAELELDEDDEMEGEIIGTLSRLEKGWGTLSDNKKQNLQVRLTNKALHSAQIIRAGDRILVATYLAEKGGSSSPTMQIRGEESKLYETYKDQIDILWKRARKLDHSKLKRMLDKRRQDCTRPDTD